LCQCHFKLISVIEEKLALILWGYMAYVVYGLWIMVFEIENRKTKEYMPECQ